MNSVYHTLFFNTLLNHPEALVLGNYFSLDSSIIIRIESERGDIFPRNENYFFYPLILVSYFCILTTTIYNVTKNALEDPKTECLSFDSCDNPFFIISHNERCKIRIENNNLWETINLDEKKDSEKPETMIIKTQPYKRMNHPHNSWIAHRGWY